MSASLSEFATRTFARQACQGEFCVQLVLPSQAMQAQLAGRARAIGSA